MAKAPKTTSKKLKCPIPLLEGAKVKKVNGRPTLYSAEMAQKVCDLIATTPISVKRICAINSDIPSSPTVYNWMATKPGFLDMYLKAKQSQAFLHAEELVDMAESVDESSPAGVAKGGLILKATQWHLARLAPKTFSDRSVTEVVDAGAEELKKTVAEIKADIALLSKHEKDC